MQFEFQPGERTQLPLLPGLPDARLARLEGYNGIGKTLSVRVLQLCSGRQSFLGLPRAWTSMCDAIGDLTVVASGLRGGESIRWRARVEHWPETPEPEVGADWFDIEIDGRSASLEEVRALLGVERLAGDAGLAETLALQIDADRQRVESVIGPRVKQDESVLAAGIELLDAGVQVVRRVGTTDLMRTQAAATEARAVLEAARTSLHDASERLEELRFAHETQVRLDEHDRLGKSLDEQIRAFEAELEDLAASREPLVKRLVDVEEEANRTEEARAAMKRVRDRLDRHLRAEKDERDAIAVLQVAAQLEDLDLLDEVVAELKRELADLIARRAAIDAAPLLREVATDLAARLRHAESEGLTERRLFDEPGPGHAMTVADWRKLLEARATALAKQAPTLQGAAVATRIEQVNRRLGAAEEILRRRVELARRARLAAQAQDEIDQLVRESDPRALEAADGMRRELQELDDRVRHVAYQRAAMASMAIDADPTRTPAQLRADLESRLEQLGVEGGDVASVLSLEASAVAAAGTRFEEAERADREASEELSILLTSLDRATILIAEDEQFAWLRQLPGVPLPDPATPVDRQIETLTRLGDILERALERAGKLPAQVAAISVALDQISRRLKGLDESPAGVYGDALTEGYGREFAKMFDLPSIRGALFGDATTVLGVDLRRNRLDVRYTNALGEHVAKPLETFSRGEQAFAYTQARLEALDAATARPQNRLVVLDEFGAFVARDRLARLIGLLSERAREHEEDQILLILPASSDYRAQAEVAVGPEQDRLTQLAERIETRGFVVEDLAIHAP